MRTGIAEEARSYEMQCFMSKKGDPWDNAPMESLFSALKTELIPRRKYKNRADEARADILEYVEVLHNRKQIQACLG